MLPHVIFILSSLSFYLIFSKVVKRRDDPGNTNTKGSSGENIPFLFLGKKTVEEVLSSQLVGKFSCMIY
jgi:hypothetical protein